MNIETSKSLFAQANSYIPGGVNSPVRAFKSVGGDPIFMARAQGAYMYDADGNAYLDLINSWGPMILGHAYPPVVEAVREVLPESFSFGTPTEIEVEMAEIITRVVPSVEKVRMVNSGTEATMSAIRLARGYTGRNKMIKFAGCYHGHGDSFLIAAGSGAMTFGVPNSPGVPEGVAQDTLIAEFNNLENVSALVDANPDQVAAIILEPVTGNMGVIVPDAGFLEGLRKLCDEKGIVLIFDEVMTGFRLAVGGAQERLGVTPDLTTLGKIIGGGMPVGAYGGKREIMEYVSPAGPVYQAGTLSGNPLAMRAGHVMLSTLTNHPEIYTEIDATTEQMANGMAEIFTEKGVAHNIARLGSMFTLFFREEAVRNFEDAKACDTAAFGKFFRNMLSNGIYLPPSQFEAVFVSREVKAEQVDQFLTAVRASL
ncbi:glutamate-1-semialdehyde 2,1-aminomutase [Pontibacter sp. G13]|uniref:glutamate-1-semialdehyde 2,1-aminomutase n=1 Tax=Pontibacter sp. G13 TaxID=3074898 RepID=UPI00288A0387|nr:glutamate-1-semialdehyde 2,1-aminomutase [Pontibacter sp. G13]WNJ20044.1 glutamate-1-semialdehyde 2,1-aminomutase [Pontibacter sp. G13]